MATIYIIRHGQASFGAQNYDQLSPTGYEQASFLGKHLSTLPIQIQDVVIGGMLRHRQTAENSLLELNYQGEKIIDTCWNEFDHTSILAQYRPEYADISFIKREIEHLPNPMEAFQKIFEEAIIQWVSGKYPEKYPESWEDMVKRTVAGFEKVKSKVQPGQAILVYTSAGTISALLSHLLDLSIEETFSLQWKMPNCAVTTVKIDGDQIQVNDVNNFHFFENQSHLLTYR